MASETTFSANELFLHLKRKFSRFDEEVVENATSLGRYYCWDICFFAEACLLAFEKTGEFRFLEVLTPVIEKIVGTTDSKMGYVNTEYGRAFKAWGTDRQYSNRKFSDNRYVNIVTHAGRISSILFWYSYVTLRYKNRSGSLCQHAIGIDDLSLRAMLAGRDALMEFEDSYRFNEELGLGYYFRDDENRVEALNHCTILGEAFLFGCLVLDSQYMKDRLRALYAFFVSSLYLTGNDTLVWNYRPTPADPHASKSEPIWKGFVTCRFFYHCSRFDVFNSSIYFEKISKSVFLNVYRKGSVTAWGCNAVISDRQVMLESEKGLTKSRGVQDLLAYGILSLGCPGVEDVIIELTQELGHEFWFSHNPNLLSYSHFLS